MTTSPASSPPARTPAQRVRRILWRVGVFLAVLYIGLSIVLYALQSKMMFPGAISQGAPDAVVTPPAGCELLHLKTRGGQDIVVLYGPALDSTGHPLDPRNGPTLLWFYGNGMCLANSMAEFDEFRRMGMNVLIPEFVGYGMSTGSPGEDGCYQTADAAWDLTLARPETDRSRIVVGGWSLGAAIAIDLASRHPQEVARLMIFSAFTSAPDVGARFYPYLPVRTLLKYRFDSQLKIGKIACPILIGHGRRDEIVPFDMSEKLTATARAAGRDITAFAVDAGHNDFFDAGGKVVNEEVTEFLKPVQTPPAP